MRGIRDWGWKAAGRVARDRGYDKDPQRSIPSAGLLALHEMKFVEVALKRNHRLEV